MNPAEFQLILSLLGLAQQLFTISQKSETERSPEERDLMEQAHEFERQRLARNTGHENQI